MPYNNPLLAYMGGYPTQANDEESSPSGDQSYSPFPAPSTTTAPGIPPMPGAGSYFTNAGPDISPLNNHAQFQQMADESNKEFHPDLQAGSPLTLDDKDLAAFTAKEGNNVDLGGELPKLSGVPDMAKLKTSYPDLDQGDLAELALHYHTLNQSGDYSQKELILGLHKAAKKLNFENKKEKKADLTNEQIQARMDNADAREELQLKHQSFGNLKTLYDAEKSINDKLKNETEFPMKPDELPQNKKLFEESNVKMADYKAKMEEIQKNIGAGGTARKKKSANLVKGTIIRDKSGQRWKVIDDAGNLQKAI